MAKQLIQESGWNCYLNNRDPELDMIDKIIYKDQMKMINQKGKEALKGLKQEGFLNKYKILRNPQKMAEY